MVNLDLAMPTALLVVILVAFFLNKKSEGKLKDALEELGDEFEEEEIRLIRIKFLSEMAN